MLWGLRRFRLLAVCGVLRAATVVAQAPDPNAVAGVPSAPITTLKVNSQLVFLDVTVLDKKGRPVTSGLTKDDFAITEDKQPQRIFSFEPPQAHVAEKARTQDPLAGNVPATIFVLDELNSTFDQAAYYRINLERYLKAQPETLAAPAELMVLSGYNAADIVQGFTRDRADLLTALGHIPAELPNGNLDYGDRALKTFHALDGIALETMGTNGRKNVIWLGTGVAISTIDLPEKTRTHFEEYMRLLTNTLVDARLSLYVIFPGLDVNRPEEIFDPHPASDLAADIKDPYRGLVNFSNLARETGGDIYVNENAADHLMKRALERGMNYYTLTYQPQSRAMDSKFRQIRVAMRDPQLHALTKTGYYSPDQNEVADPQRKANFQLIEAARNSLKLDEIHLSVSSIVRHPDAGTADFHLFIAPNHLPWVPFAGTSVSSIDLSIAGVTLERRGAILASRLRQSHFVVGSQDSTVLAQQQLSTEITLQIPRKADRVRIVLRTLESGRMGSAEIPIQAIAAAPEAPTPEPVIPPLNRHRAPPPADPVAIVPAPSNP